MTKKCKENLCHHAQHADSAMGAYVNKRRRGQTDCYHIVLSGIPLHPNEKPIEINERKCQLNEMHLIGLKFEDLQIERNTT